MAYQFLYEFLTYKWDNNQNKTMVTLMIFHQIYFLNKLIISSISIAYMFRKVVIFHKIYIQNGCNFPYNI